MVKDLQHVRVWDRTTRIFHWINAVAVLSLMAVGTVILNHDLLGIEGDATILLKKIHVAFGYLFAINLLWRLVWAFIGGYYARWRQFLPVGKNYLSELRMYVVGILSGKRLQYKGHNPAGRLIISLFFLVLSTQAATGLVIAGTDLYYPPFGNYFAEWVTEGDVERLNALRPGDTSQTVESAYQDMRAFRSPIVTLHVYGYYILLLLVLIHIAGVIVTEIREKNALISAMITGEKVLDAEPVDKDQT